MAGMGMVQELKSKRFSVSKHDMLLMDSVKICKIRFPNNLNKKDSKKLKFCI